ncbi:MAG: TIM barrel protein [Fimbriimonadaceae bacterium]|nr:TIM barrel protein [Fimbriimonadaceae bacterium]
MGRINQAFTCGPFAQGGKVPMAELFATAAAIGFKGVDLSGPYDINEVVVEAPKHGLQVVAIGGHQSLRDGLNKLDNHDRIEAELREKIAFAADHNVRNLICFPGNRNGLDDYRGLLNTAEGLKRVAELAEQKGVNLVVELLNSKVNHPDYQADRTLWGVVMCELVGSPRVGLLYDIYHMQIMEGDLIRNIRDWGKYFLHYHTAGNPGRNDLDDQQEIYYPAVMRAIADTGYDGFVGHEFSPKGEDKIASLRQAFEVCDI